MSQTPRLFPRGFLVTFKAVSYPLPGMHRESLIKAGKAAIDARKALDLAKDSGNKLRINDAEQAYKLASSAVEITETLIRNSIGADYSRAEFLLGVRRVNS